MRAMLSRLTLILATALLPAAFSEAGVLEIRALNARSAEPLAGLEIHAMKLLDGEELSWQRSGVTDDRGLLSLDLDGLGDGDRYTLISNPYNGGFAYSDPITSPGTYDYRLGALRVTAINGNDGTPLVNARLGAMRVEPDGTLRWQTEGLTDALGTILLDLPELDAGTGYKLYALNPFDGRPIYSEELKSSGEFRFDVGEPLLEARVVDGISGEALPLLDLLLVELIEDGSMQWVSTGTTDASGRAYFELPGIASGSRFQLLTTVFNEVLSTSPVIVESGPFTFQVGRLRVSLIDGAEGKPLPGQTVIALEQLADGSVNPVLMGTTDASGIIRFDLAGLGSGRNYVLESTSPVDGSIKRSAQLGGNGDFQFRIGNAPLSVTFRDAATGAALSGRPVYVILVNADGSQEGVATGVTDAEGRVSFDLEPPGEGQELLLAANPYDSGWVFSDPVSAAGAVDFSVGGLPVTLRSAADGSPLAGKTLILGRRIGEDQLDMLASGVTDTNGLVHFDAPGLGGGEVYTILAQDVFGEEGFYFSPWISQAGPFDFFVSGDQAYSFDWRAPLLEVTSPEVGERVSAAGFLVEGIASDDQQLESVALEVAGAAGGLIEIPATLEGEQWRAALPGSSISIGSTAEFTVVARDRMGNETRLTVPVDVIADAGAPALSVRSHNSLDHVPASGFLLSGLVTDDIGVQDLTATLRQPGGATLPDAAEVSLADDGSWSLPVVSAAAGEPLQIELRARDLDGNETLLDLTLQVVTPNDGIAHAISRITFGATPDLLEATRGSDARAFIQAQLDPESIDESALEAMLAVAGKPADNMSLQSWLMLRAIFAERQLLEKMTWFWENHFSTNLLKTNSVAYELRENEGFRQHALGRFRDLLEVSATSPAMLIYLDNIANSVTAPNENYARELLELHTLGVDGGYTESDVWETARVLTGWGIKDNDAYLYDWAHDKGSKTVLGTPFDADGGPEEISQLLDLLAAHPSTARHICRKLLQYFVAEQPSAPSVEDCSAVFMTTDGDMRTVVGSILQSDAFRHPDNHLNLAKTPLEYIASLMRALQPEIDQQQTGFLMYLMGMPLFYQGSPAGYPESGEEWINAGQLAQRILAVNALIYADAGTAGSFQNDAVAALTSRGFHTADAMLGYMAELTLGNAFGGTEWELAREALTGKTGVVDLGDPGLEYRVRLALALMLSAPGFQLQ